MSPGRTHRPVRIAYPLASLRIGGAELRALSLVERLPKDRFEVHFISLTGEGPLDERGRAAGARIHYLGDRALSTSPRAVQAIGRLGKLARYTQVARLGRFDIVDAWLYPTDVFVTLMRRLTRTPIIVTGRADLLPRHAFGPLSARVDRFVNRRVDAIVANSGAVAEANRGAPGVDPTRLHVIRNGVEPRPPVDEVERRRLRAELGAGEEDVLVGAVGMLREVKRHELLIDAFARCASSHPELRLAIIGEGPMREALEQQVDRLGLAGRVALPGAIVDVRPLFDAFDVVASSSHSEGMPNALLEAASAGRPIVTTAAGGAVEVVTDGTSGLIVPVDDGDALAAALARVSTDRELRRRFGDAAREHVAVTFGMERFVEEWVRLYEGLARTRGLISD